MAPLNASGGPASSNWAHVARVPPKPRISCVKVPRTPSPCAENSTAHSSSHPATTRSPVRLDPRSSAISRPRPAASGNATVHVRTNTPIVIAGARSTRRHPSTNAPRIVARGRPRPSSDEEGIGHEHVLKPAQPTQRPLVRRTAPGWICEPRIVGPAFLHLQHVLGIDIHGHYR